MNFLFKNTIQKSLRCFLSLHSLFLSRSSVFLALNSVSSPLNHTNDTYLFLSHLRLVFSPSQMLISNTFLKFQGHRNLFNHSSHSSILSQPSLSYTFSHPTYSNQYKYHNIHRLFKSSTSNS